MKKAILMAIKPQYLFKILNGEKTIEIRKTIPNCELPIDVYLYCTKEKNEFDKLEKQDGEYYYGDPCYTGWERKLNGKVVAKFTLNEIDKYIAEFTENDCYEDVRYVYLNEDGEEESEIIFTNEVEDDILESWKFPKSCVKYRELRKYVGIGFDKPFYAWHIDSLEIFNKAMELSDFYKNDYEMLKEDLESIGCNSNNCLYKVDNSILGDDGYCNFDFCPKLKITKSPQSWQYVYVGG